MTHPAVQTLFIPLEEGALSLPARALFVNAGWHPFLRDHKSIVCYQPFKPDADILTSAGLQVQDTPDFDARYDLVLLHAPKQAEEARYSIARALEMLSEDGILLVAAANDAGGGRLEKWFKDVGLLSLSQSKNKARAVWAKKTSLNQDILSQWIHEGSARDMVLGDDFSGMTQPGVFSWNHVDDGSALLASHLPETLSGAAADFGCGIGYLSFQLLKKSPRISSLAMVEADARALSFAKDNITPVIANRDITTHWHDLQKPLAGLSSLDVVVMNPPFHTGKKTDVDLGLSFIAQAARSLKKGAPLFMVANTQLPYEDMLNAHFSTVEKLEQKKGFKILKAVK